MNSDQDPPDIRALVGRAHPRPAHPERFAAHAVNLAAEMLALVWTLPGDHTKRVIELAMEINRESSDAMASPYRAHEEMVVLRSEIAYMLWGTVDRMDGADDVEGPLVAMRVDLDQLAYALGIGPQHGASVILGRAIDRINEGRS